MREFADRQLIVLRRLVVVVEDRESTRNVLCLVVGEVFHRQNSAVLLKVIGKSLRELTTIESGRATCCNGFQGFGEVLEYSGDLPPIGDVYLPPR